MAMSAALDVTRKFYRRRAGSSRSRWSWLRHLLGAHERIQILERENGTLPQVFVWRGCRYGVTAVERCWSTSRPGLRGWVQRLAFRVRFRSWSDNPGVERAATIYKDLRHNIWYVRPSSR